MTEWTKDLSEADVKYAVAEYLQLCQNQGKLIFLRLNSGDFIVEAGESRRRIKGCPKGTSDFIALMPVRKLAIECKSTKGKQSPEQVAFQVLWESIGGEYYIVRSVDDLMQVV